MIDRRRLLFGTAAVAGALVVPPALADTGFPSHRWVKIVFVNTGERFNNLYFSDGSYIVPAVQQFSWTCRDYRAGQWKWIHPWLMDLVFVLHWRYNKDESLMPLLPVRPTCCKGEAGAQWRCRGGIGMLHAGCADG
jgi:uncharacterized protein YcbK (DUF882 family)